MSEEYKWDYIQKISQLSYVYNSDYMLDLLTTYNCNNLREIKCEQVKEYYLELIKMIWSKK